MRRIAAVTLLSLVVLAGCGSTQPGRPVTAPRTSPAAPSKPSPAPTSTAPTSTAPSSPAPLPVAAPTSNPKDCYHGTCTLLLTKPVTVPLDFATFHYSSLTVTAVAADHIDYQVPIPGNGAASGSAAGLDATVLSYRTSPSLHVGFSVQHGDPALVLQQGPPN